MRLRGIFSRLTPAQRKALAYQTVFGTVEGREVLADLLKFCGVGADPYRAGDASLTDYALGAHRVGLRLIGMMNMSVAEAHQLQKEQEDGEREAEPVRALG
jgi:hypothetical protein